MYIIPGTIWPEEQIEQFITRVLPHQVQLVVAAGIRALLATFPAAVRDESGSRPHGPTGSARQQAVLLALCCEGRLHAQYEVKAEIAHMT